MQSETVQDVGRIEESFEGRVTQIFGSRVDITFVL